MVPFVWFVTAAPADVRATFAAAAKAHGSLQTFRASLVVKGQDQQGAPLEVQYELAGQGERFYMRIRQKAKRNQGRSDRAFLFSKNSVTGYDAIADERLTRPLPAGNRYEKAKFILGELDEPVRYLLDGRQTALFFDNLLDLGYWKVADGNGTRLVRNVPAPKGRNVSQLTFAPRTGLLTSFSIKAPGSSSEWRIQYLPVGSLALPGSSTARRVDAFIVRPDPPKYASATAKSVTSRLISAYRNLRRGQISVRQGSSLTKLALDGERFREDSGTLSYAFDGNTLTLIDRQRRLFYQGRAARGRVPDYVAKVGNACHPMSRQWLQGFTPFEDLLVPEMTISLGGSVAMQGVSCDLLSLSSPRNRIAMAVRRDIGLLDSSSTITLDRGGRPLTTTARRYAYQLLGKAQPASMFRLAAPKGFAIRNLPVLPRL